jgi:hypothetical protein
MIDKLLIGFCSQYVVIRHHLIHFSAAMTIFCFLKKIRATRLVFSITQLNHVRFGKCIGSNSTISRGTKRSGLKLIGHSVVSFIRIRQMY